jgi:hypothetical protein
MPAARTRPPAGEGASWRAEPSTTHGVATLLASLRAAGAEQQAAALTGRLSAAGMSGLFLEEQKDLAYQFRFGREANGDPAAPWRWEDLD